MNALIRFALCGLLLAPLAATAQTVGSTIAVGTTPAAIAVNPITNKIYVANDGSNNVSVIDGATHTSTPVAVGNRPLWLAVNPETNRVFVGNFGDSNVSVINGATQAVIGTLLTGGVGWTSVLPQRDRTYMIRYGAGDEVNVLAGDGYLLTSATRSYQPVSLAVNPATNVLYMAHAATGDVVAIDVSVDTLYPTLFCPDGAGGHKPSPGQHDPDPGPCINVSDTPAAVAVNPATNRIYVASSGTTGVISVIRGLGETNPHTFTALSPPGVGGTAKAIALNPVTNKIYAAYSSHIVIVDGATNAMTVIAAPEGPVAVGIDILTNKVYVPTTSGALYVIDGATNASSTIAITPGAIAVAVNPLTHTVYVLTSGGVVPVQGAAADPVQTMPLTTTITPLPGNTTGPSGSITLQATSSFAQPALGVRKVYYRLDGGAWTAASGSGPYTAAFTGLAAGPHTIEAFATNGLDAPSIMTDKQNNPLVGNVVSYAFTASAGTASVSLASSQNPSNAGQSVTFTASVTGSSGTPTGTVAIRDGGVALPGCGAITLSGGSGACVASNLAVGSHTITAAYSGNATYDPAESSPITQTVQAVVAQRATDLNGDGQSDLLYWNNATGQVYRMLMNGFGIAAGGFIYQEANTAWKVVGDGDFDGNGTADLLWRNDVTGQVYILFLGSNGAMSSGAMAWHEPNTAWKIVQTPDLDGDGKSDILWWNSSTGQVYAMLMNGATVTQAGFVYTEADTSWRIVAAGDFSGAGRRNQLVWRNAVTGQLYMMTVQVSAGGFSASGAIFYQESNLAWKIVGAADFNGNGRTDLLWRNDSTGQVYMMLMDGATIASARMIWHEPNTAWKIVAQGDYNGDGRADLLWRNDATGQVYMMLMNGLAVTNAAMVYQESNTAWKLLGPAQYAQ